MRTWVTSVDRYWHASFWIFLILEEGFWVFSRNRGIFTESISRLDVAVVDLAVLNQPQTLTCRMASTFNLSSDLW